ncbi:TFC5 [Hepatospora eriocheir]|uniref:TFC5 n=1 Tax=Hepatospora eriocheir TaxID=1081669 RepID=A0A1X0QLL9_9MICR|nr:TFC5 [Hepatospora eriocheir]ORE00576.1 TFC5 [Hepatospora eriocheir]
MRNSDDHDLTYYCNNYNFKTTKSNTQKHQSQQTTSSIQVVDGHIVVLEKQEKLDEGIVTSSTYSKNKAIRVKWTKEENDLFFKGLSLVGCDFSMLNLLFENKTRKNLRDKYKSEMRKRPSFVKNILECIKEFNKEDFNKLRDK